MTKKRTYFSVDVEAFDVGSVMDRVRGGCIVAIDVAKTGFYAGIADQGGNVAMIIRFQHPVQTRAFLSVIESIRDRGIPLQVAMEPTGSYGDAVRHQIHVRGVAVYMTSPKHTHDMAEVIDGVPSMHDAKAVVVLSKLHAIKPGKLWQPEAESRRNTRTTFDRREIYAEPLQRHYNRLEALMARFWPEFDGVVDVRVQRSWMALLEEFPGPEMVASNAEQARDLLRRASRGALPRAKINAIVDAATGSLGVPMQPGDRTQLRELVQEIRRLRDERRRLDEELAKVLRAEKVADRMVPVIGTAASAAILGYLGDPREYASAGALEKAAGLNLKVRSSGKHAGQLKITKRGPGAVRSRLHLASLRLINSDPVVRAWYGKRKGVAERTKLKGVIAVSRKLVRAIWHVTNYDQAFDARKLFDTRSLQIDTNEGKPSRIFGGRRSRVASQNDNLSTRGQATA